MKASSLMSIGLDSKHIPKEMIFPIMSSEVMGESSTSIYFNGDFSFTFSTSIKQSPSLHFLLLDTQVKLKKKSDARLSLLLSPTSLLLKIYPQKGTLKNTIRIL